MRVAIDRPPQRRITALAAAIGSVFLAGVLVLSFDQPIAVIGALLVFATCAALIRFPIVVLIAFLFVEPFHLALVVALQKRGHVGIGPLVYWKDALILALFARGVAERFLRDRRMRLPHQAGDRLLVLYVLMFILIAALLPRRATVGAALGVDIEGPLLFLAIRFLRPSRRQLWLCAGAIVGAASVIGVAAIIERFGPQIDFQTWYGAPPGGVFYTGPHRYRSGSFLNSPLVLGFYLAGATPFAVALATVRSRWRPAAVLSVAACAGGLLTTVTRSGYIGGGIGLIVVLLLTVRNPGVRLSLVGMVVVISGVSVLYYTSSGSDTLVRSESNTGHLSALERDFNLLLARPFGYGLGTTDRFSQEQRDAPGTLGVTESTFMAYALEGGIAALILYLVVLYTTGMRLRRSRVRASHRTRDPAGKALAAGGIGAMLGVALSGLFLGIHEQVIEVLLWGAPAVALAWPLAGERSRFTPA